MIVVPVADENLGFRALKKAIEMAKDSGEEIVVVHSLFGGNKTTLEDIRRGERLLEKAVEIAEKSGVKASKRMLIRGKTPAEDIVDVAEELNADMIVMGCGVVEIEGRRILRETTEQVLVNSRKPVLLVK
ncbi:MULTISPECIES: universal stress protein [unclassified Archaeoglobus]|jgi:nucleotide-binding universal stress UspA family protein|uniref:universal stress protein n=1 Tax=unclassified Archaeoglobus TaxID=2643606 RepID=UPI0025C498E5|nr:MULTISPECIES: universal stress protein [unclassified Archaeoglobus]